MVCVPCQYGRQAGQLLAWHPDVLQVYATMCQLYGGVLHTSEGSCRGRTNAETVSCLMLLRETYCGQDTSELFHKPRLQGWLCVRTPKE